MTDSTGENGTDPLGEFLEDPDFIEDQDADYEPESIPVEDEDRPIDDDPDDLYPDDERAVSLDDEEPEI